MLYMWASQGPKTSAADNAVSRGAPGHSRRRGRENVKEFLAKKREIFLVQMGLDTKQLEINKLEERAMRRYQSDAYQCSFDHFPVNYWAMPHALLLHDSSASHR